MPGDRAVRTAVIALGCAAAVSGVLVAGTHSPERPVFAAVKAAPAGVLAVTCLRAHTCSSATGARVVLLDASGQDPISVCQGLRAVTAPVEPLPGIAACLVEG